MFEQSAGETMAVWLAVVKLTAVLGTGWLLWAMLGTSNPRWRVLALRGTVLALVAMPVAALLGPSVEVEALPGKAGSAWKSVNPPGNPRGHQTEFDAAGLVASAPRHEWAETVAPIDTALPSTAGAIAAPSSGTSNNGPMLILGLVYTFVVTALALRLAWSHRLVRRFVVQSLAADQEIQAEFETIARELGTRRLAQVRTLEGISTPFLTGLLAPVLLLPERMLEPAYRRELRGVFLHEACHLRSNDLFWSYAVHITGILLWWHPLAWRMERAHSAACEAVSDAVAAERWGSAERYARLLARVAVELASNPPVRAGIPMARVSEISRRLAMLRRGVRANPLRRRSVLLLAIPLFVGVGAIGGIRLVAASEAPKERVELSQPVSTQKVNALQEALAKPDGPGTIELEEGVYTAPITIERSVKLVGKGPGRTEFRMLSDEPAITVRGAVEVMLTDLSVVWSPKSTDTVSDSSAAVYVRDSERVVLHGVRLEPHDRPLETPSGLVAAGRSTVEFRSGSAQGFAYAILFTGGAKGMVLDSVLTGAGHSVITQHENTDIQIAGNVLGECGYHAVRNTGGTMRMTGNIVFNNTRAGVYLGNKPAKGEITGNLFTGSNGEIWSYYTSSVDIRDNYFVNSRGPAIGAWQSCTHLIHGNTFIGNPMAIQVYDKGEPAGKLTLTSNHYQGNKLLSEPALQEAAASMEPRVYRNPSEADFRSDTPSADQTRAERIRELYARHADLLAGKLDLTLPEASPAITPSGGWQRADYNTLRDWGPEQATGAPDTPRAGDLPTAWASLVPDAGQEWLELDYDPPIAANMVRIYETFNPGAVTLVSAIDANGNVVATTKAERGPAEAPRVLEVPISVPGGTTVKTVRLDIDTTNWKGWYEVDAMELVGDSIRAWASAARASSTYATARETQPPPSESLIKQYRVLIGAFGDPSAAKELEKKLTNEGMLLAIESSEGITSIYAPGIFQRREEAEKLAEVLRNNLGLAPDIVDVVAPMPQGLSQVTRTIVGASTEYPLDVPGMRLIDPTDGTAEGKRSFAGGGHARRFVLEEESARLMAVELFGSRYGTDTPPDEKFEVVILTADMKPIATVYKDYALFAKGSERWVTMVTPDVTVPQEFWVAFNFNPTQTKGVYTSFDESTKGNSLSGRVQSGFSPANIEGDWMIRVRVAPAEVLAPRDSVHIAPPRIVSTIPAIGATDVDPALEAIEVTFDRDMADGFSWTGGGPNHPQVPEGKKVIWKDKRTCVYPVGLEPAKFYRIGINWGSRFSNFRSVDGKPTETRTIQFTTRGASVEEQGKLAIPTIVSMDPPNGATGVDPNTKEMRVTFSVPMGSGYSFTGGGDNYPRNAPENPARWSEDGKTITLAVELQPNWRYELGINSFSFKNFSSEHGVPVEPVVWRFETGP